MKNKIKQSTKCPLAIALIMSSQCVMAGELKLGAAVINSHTAIQGKPAETKVFPAIIYQGENFSFVFDTLAYRFFAVDGLTVSMTGKLRQEPYEPKDSDALNGMDKRDGAFDMGINVQSAKPWGTLELEAVGDVSSAYDGYEVKASYVYPWMGGRWLLKPEVGTSYSSRQLVGYYYGVKDSEQTVDRPTYRGKGAVNSFAKITAFYRLNEKWSVVGGMNYTRLDNAITKSPIVDESYETTVFTAITYAF